MIIDTIPQEDLRIVCQEFGNYTIIGNNVIFEGQEPTLQEVEAKYLIAKKKEANLIVNIHFENERNKIDFIGAGQQATYTEKVNAATKQIDGDILSDEEKLWLENEIGIWGNTATEVANAILIAKSEWVQAGQAIEKSRIQAKEQIRLATTIDQIKLVTENL